MFSPRHHLPLLHWLLHALQRCVSTLRRPSYLVVWLLAFMLALPALPTRAAEGIDIEQANLEKSDEGYVLSADFELELNRGLEDALNRGVPLYFTTEVDITRKRWYWLDERTVSATRTVRLSYNVLTRRYHAAIVGQIQQSFETLDDALLVIRHPNRWLIAETGVLKSGVTYNVALKMELDVTQLPKPFQVHALNSSDWRLSSDKITFQFRTE